MPTGIPPESKSEADGISFSDERPKADSTSMMTVEFNGRH
jgi:hypothetical protein